MAMVRQEQALAKPEAEVSGANLLVVFALAGQEYGLFSCHVREIIRNRPTTRVPNSSAIIDGVINLRGRIIPVFNLRRRLGLAELTPEQRAQQAVMIIEHDGNDAGLLVDRVSDVVKIIEDDIDRSTRLVESTMGQRFIDGTVKLSGRLVTLLKLAPLLSS